MQEAPPSPPESASSSIVHFVAIVTTIVGILLCFAAFFSARNLLAESNVIFPIKDPEFHNTRYVQIAKPSTPWLNLSLLALSVGFLVSLRSLYLIARRKKAAVSSSLLAAKIILIGGTLLFAGIDFGGDYNTNQFCVMSLLPILYATLSYRAYSSPLKLAALLSRE